MFSNIVLMTLIVKDMSLFDELNDAYKSFFGINPSTRVTVQIEMTCDIMIDCLAYNGDKDTKETLHVQGISYWAPANIGPYSQACRIQDFIFMAGMIGLIPHKMELFQSSNPEETFKTQLLQCITNSINVADAISQKKAIYNDTLLCICFITNVEFYFYSKAALNKFIKVKRMLMIGF
jgi:diphthine-ammonia ligase